VAGADTARAGPRKWAVAGQRPPLALGADAAGPSFPRRRWLAVGLRPRGAKFHAYRVYSTTQTGVPTGRSACGRLSDGVQLAQALALGRLGSAATHVHVFTDVK
jgi:hypothetical protein